MRRSAAPRVKFRRLILLAILYKPTPLASPFLVTFIIPFIDDTTILCERDASAATRLLERYRGY